MRSGYNIGTTEHSGRVVAILLVYDLSEILTTRPICHPERKVPHRLLSPFTPQGGSSGSSMQILSGPRRTMQTCRLTIPRPHGKYRRRVQNQSRRSLTMEPCVSRVNHLPMNLSGSPFTTSGQLPLQRFRSSPRRIEASRDEDS